MPSCNSANSPSAKTWTWVSFLSFHLQWHASLALSIHEYGWYLSCSVLPKLLRIATLKVGDKQFWQSLAHIVKATYLKYPPLRIGCNRHYFRSLNLLAWTHLSQQSYGSVTMMSSFYSNITYESSVSVYIGYTTALQCIWIMHAGPKGA